MKDYSKGIFIYTGIDEYENEIFQIIEPTIKCNIFYYNCSNKFNIDVIKKYLNNYSGTIIFVNGKECIIYEYQYEFIKKKHINGNLIKRHKKGGQSQARFGRLADDSRTHYVSYIIENLNKIKTSCNWIFGSDEIINLIKDKQSNIYIPLKYGGFYDFNLSTINNTQYWINYFTLIDDNIYDNIYKEIITLLDTNIDCLDFNPSNAHEMKWFISKIPLSDELNNSKSKINLINSSKYYSRLSIFDFIGVKYYKYEIEDIIKDNI